MTNKPDWYSCGDKCYSAKIGQYMGHIRSYPENAFLWSWNGCSGIAFTLDDAKLDVERVAQTGEANGS
jgi:hypothetical protein